MRQDRNFKIAQILGFVTGALCLSAAFIAMVPEPWGFRVACCLGGVALATFLFTLYYFFTPYNQVLYVETTAVHKTRGQIINCWKRDGKLYVKEYNDVVFNYEKPGHLIWVELDPEIWAQQAELDWALIGYIVLASLCILFVFWSLPHLAFFREWLLI
jgi:hypothetical protein